jgi:hypothetical protein
MPNTDKLKPFHVLPCADLPRIQAEVMEWIHHQRPGLLMSDSLWNKCDTLPLLRAAPTLSKWFDQLDLKIRELAVTVVKEHEIFHLHIDELPVTAKINIPIQNTKNSCNRWYEIPEDLLKDYAPKTNEFGKKYYNFEGIDYSRLKMVGETELDGPLVFNSQIAHNIIIGEHAKFPRVVLACMFFHEPIHYLRM